MSAQHTPATRRIQARLERMELAHLRQLVAEQAERIEDLERAQSDIEASAEFWRDSHNNLRRHLDDDTEDARCVGLTKTGELLVVRAGEAV